MLQMFNNATADLAAAKTEASFWDTLRAVTASIEAWPNGWVMLGTPSMPYTCLRHVGLADHLSLVEARHFGDVPTIRTLGLAEIGNIRRDIRKGQFVVSAMDTKRQWHVVYDARDTRTQFTDPMLSWSDLGFKQEPSHVRAAA